MSDNQSTVIYEGKAKKILSINSPNKVLIEFKNDATAFNAKKRETIEGKGRLNCLISAHIFQFLESRGVNTHYLGLKSEKLMLAKAIDIIPLEVVIRNVATGSLCRETPIKEGTNLKEPLLDLYFKDDSMGDPLITRQRLTLLELVEPTQIDFIERIAFNVNILLKEFFRKIDLQLIDFKIELGFDSKGEILIADEISPDNCRIWDPSTQHIDGKILDKDRFRKNLGGLLDAYSEILKRIEEVSSIRRL
tara:strand:+ start:876 stop:1622 length:747 start_codon:yes stop_codon:yes gene_type:complete